MTSLLVLFLVSGDMVTTVALLRLAGLTGGVWESKTEVSSTMTLTCEGSGTAKVEEFAVAGALPGVSGPILASPSSLKIWLAARIFRGMRWVVLRWDGRREGGGAGVRDTGWIGRAASKFCRASATTSEEKVNSNPTND